MRYRVTRHKCLNGAESGTPVIIEFRSEHELRTTRPTSAFKPHQDDRYWLTYAWESSEDGETWTICIDPRLDPDDPDPVSRHAIEYPEVDDHYAAVEAE